jgi:hypothetical protein
VYQWCEFKSRRGKNKNVSAQRSNSNTVWFNFQRTLDLMIITLFRNCKLIAIPVMNISNKSTKKMYMLYMYLLFHLLVVTCDILVDRVKRGSIILFWNGMNKRRWLCRYILCFCESIQKGSQPCRQYFHSLIKLSITV